MHRHHFAERAAPSGAADALQEVQPSRMRLRHGLAAHPLYDLLRVGQEGEHAGTRRAAAGPPAGGGALPLAVPQPLVARRSWLWRAGNGEVIEAVGFAPVGFGGAGSSSGDAGRSWLAGLAGGAVHEDSIGAGEG